MKRQVQAEAQIVAAFGQQASKAVGDYAGQQMLELQRQAERETDPQRRAELQAEADNWAEGGAYRVAAHGVMGLLGGGLEGALGAAGAAASASLLDELTQDLPTGVKQAVGAGLAAGIGGVLGGSTGASSGFNTDANNRQLHQYEAQLLARLKEGKSQEEQDRLDAAACALVQCAGGVPQDDPSYAQLSALRESGQGYAVELDALKATGQFSYGMWDSATDLRTRYDEVVTRLKGVGNAFGGAAGMVGGGAVAAAGVVSCPATVGSCVLVPVGAGLSGLGYVQAQTGVDQALGSYTSTQGAGVLASFDPLRAEPLNPLVLDTLDVLVIAAETVLAKGAGKLLDKGDVPKGGDGVPPHSGGDARPDLPSQAHNADINTKSVLGLKAGQLPGTPIGGLGTPREMTASANPSATAENFVIQFFGNSQINKKPIAGCEGCWRAQTSDGMWVTYRPAGQASRATASTTATVEINGFFVNNLNSNVSGKPQVLKLKFPAENEVGL